MNTLETCWKDRLGKLATQRKDRLVEVMRKTNLPALLVLDSVNIMYATGASNMTIFSIRTPARYLLILADGPTILFEYFGSEHLAKNLTTIDEVRPARGLCYVSSGGDPVAQARGLATEISNIFKDLDLSVDQLAIDRFPIACIDALRSEGYTLTDADAIFSAARRVKLAGEIEVIEEALARVTQAASEMESLIEPGRSEVEIWANFQRSFLASEGRYISTRLLQSGNRTYPYFQEAGPRKLESGELLCFDTDAVGFAGYCTDFSRTYLCGDTPASATQLELYGRAREQLDHNVALFTPSASFEEIAARAWPVPPEHQSSRYYCIGHGLGMSGEFPNIPPYVPGKPYLLQGELQTGMVICVESYVGSEIAGQGVKLEDQLLITESGTKRMSANVPFDERLMSREF